jgi:tetratricopeptide (TPR) repeat protein
VVPVGEESPVDRCSALWEAQRYAEVASEAMAALTSASMLSMDEVAKLWGLAGLAKQALGDHDGARAAFEEAILASSAEDRPTWERHLAALALDIGRSLLARSQGGSGIDPEERVGTIRSAITWLDGGVAVVPGDAALREAAAEARRALWPTYEEVVAGLVQRQEFHLARRLLREAMADEECPPDLQGTFRDLLAATFGGEVGQLTAEAIRRMQEGKEEEAVATLERAETLLATIPADGLPAKRRQELERRLWWSYTKLGLRRVEGGMYEEALPPLLHALGFEGVGPERQEETRGPLVRALEAIVESRSGLIRRLADEGDHEAASLVGDKVWGFLKEAMDRGVTREELATALNKAQQLFERLGRPLP